MSVSDKNKSQVTCMTFLGSAVIKWQHLIIGEKEQDSLYGLDKLGRKFIPVCMTFVKGLLVFFFLSFIFSQRVLYANRRESAVDKDGEPEPMPIPGTFSGRVPQIIELVTVSSN